MKSQINLLQKEFIPKFEWVCANHFVALIATVTLLCTGTYGLIGHWHQQKQENVAAIQSQIKKQQQSIEEMTQMLTDRTVDAALQAQLSMFNDQAAMRGSLLKHIQSLSVLKQRSFSVLFDSLAQSASSELWLTHFLVTPNELNIEGGISTPRALPKWISELSKTSFFTGQEFSLASVQREETGLIFTLNSVNKSGNARNNPNDVNALVQTGVNNER